MGADADAQRLAVAEQGQGGIGIDLLAEQTVSADIIHPGAVGCDGIAEEQRRSAQLMRKACAGPAAGRHDLYAALHKAAQSRHVLFADLVFAIQACAVHIDGQKSDHEHPSF